MQRLGAASDPNHWRCKKALAGGGALPGSGLYYLNTTHFLLGIEPPEVFYAYRAPGSLPA